MDSSSASAFLRILGPLVISSALNNARSMNLGSQTLDSTLLVCLVKDHTALVLMFGDGNILLKVRQDDGSFQWEKTSAKYESGAPLYLTYTMNHDRASAYCEEFGKLPVRMTRTVFDTGESFNLFDVGIFERKNVLAPKPADYLQDFYLLYRATSILRQNVEIAAICSDGLDTYQKIGEEAIDSLEIAKQISAFKNTHGEFVTRRMNRIKHDFMKEAIVHQDDISVAAIHCEYEQNENRQTH